MTTTTTDDFLADYERLLHDAAERLADGERPRRARPRALAFAAPLAAAVAAAAVLLAVVPGDPPETTTDERPTGPPSISVLNTPREAHDRISARMITRFEQTPGIRKLGIEWEGIRRAIVHDGFSVYLVPSRDGGVCLVPDSPRTGTGLFCRSRDIALAGKLWEPVSDRDTWVIVGVVPDGVTEVTVEDDTVRRVPVEGNAYVARVGDTARISWGGGHIIWTE